jgi:hypothetical protein
MRYSTFSSLLPLLVTFPIFAKALDLNCTEASTLLFKRNGALHEAYEVMYKYMMDMCNHQPNKVCSWANVTDGTDVHLRATINLTSVEANEIKNKLKKICKNAGGRYVLENFDIGLKSNIDYMQYYSVETESYVPFDDSEYFDVSIVGFADCVDSTECNNTTEVMEITKIDWQETFNASIYNLTLHDFIWGNSTYATALDLNCTEASYLLFMGSEALNEAFILMYKFIMDMCNHQPNNVCSWANVTDGTAVHLRATINLTSIEADEIKNNIKRECSNAGGQYILETYDIGFKSNIDYVQYYSFESNSYVPLGDSEYFDISFVGSPYCITSQSAEMQQKEWSSSRLTGKKGLMPASTISLFTILPGKTQPISNN